MIDPYKVLGVSRDTSDDEIKKAYRAMSRKYHPDANINNPLREEAEARFKEVQQAYEQIIDEREKGYTTEQGQYGGFGGFGSYGGYQGQQRTSPESEGDSHLRAAANYIQGARYKEALNVLAGIGDHSALWHFYSASANSGIGNNVTALEHARAAVEMEPDNMQYQMILNRLEGGGQWYQQRQSAYGFPVMGGSSMCIRLCAASVACNICCGGGMYCGGGPYGGYM